MKRSAAMLELSREHHTALSLALRARRAAAAGPDAVAAMAAVVVERFDAELLPHFLEEESRVLPALAECGETALVARTLEEHAALARLVERLAGAPDAGTLQTFADCLGAHVRFEERELFPAAERHSETLACA